jgi:hypothetical protein
VIDDPAHQKQLETLRTELTRYFQKNGAPPIEEWRKTTKQNLTKYSN